MRRHRRASGRQRPRLLCYAAAISHQPERDRRPDASERPDVRVLRRRSVGRPRRLATAATMDVVHRVRVRGPADPRSRRQLRPHRRQAGADGRDLGQRALLRLFRRGVLRHVQIPLVRLDGDCHGEDGHVSPQQAPHFGTANRASGRSSRPLVAEPRAEPRPAAAGSHRRAAAAPLLAESHAAAGTSAARSAAWARAVRARRGAAGRGGGGGAAKRGGHAADGRWRWARPYAAERAHVCRGAAASGATQCHALSGAEVDTCR
mmetsp:Transcript_29470/g.78277  ORF Transcript_29470/g.78277 Transcript_29470/m.78277 type:complete len:262 (+) Transcript_29470:313-1098(+)